MGGFLHALGGGAVTALAMLALGPWGAFAIVAMLGLGFYREWGQHRTDVPRWNAHRVREALAWPLGGVIVALVISALR